MSEMTDISILENQLEGLEANGKDLRAKEALFIKAQGLDESIQRTIKDRDIIKTDLEKTKKDLKTLQDKKKKAVSSITEKICKSVDEFLPIGKSFFDIDDSISFGWEYDGIKQSYNSLSGGQKQQFDPALENMLGSNIMIIEAGEIDKNHLTSLLEDLSGNEKQVFVSTWFDDIEIPEAFKKVVVV